MKSQASIEYMMIFGFVVVITVPLLIAYYSYSGELSDGIISSQADKIAQKVIDSAESVYYMGEPSQTTLKVYIPHGVSSVVVSDREITYKVRTSVGISDVVRISSVNLTGNLPVSQGNYRITIRAEGSKVTLSYE